MRISGWVVGVTVFTALVFFTGLCSVVSYGSVRGLVVDLWENDIRVDSPAQVVDAVFNPDAFDITATPTLSGGEFVAAGTSGIPTAAVATVDSATSAASVTPTAGTTGESVDAAAAPEDEDAGVEHVAEVTEEEYSWDDPRRVNILLMGIDQRTGIDDDGPFRTDTMIVVSVDPVRKTAGVISFPRDLWVDIPNSPEPARINTANFIGDTIAYPGGGGPALAMETIAANFGIRVNYFVTVNFDVFETVVDTLAPGGVEICVREPIRDPDYPDAGYGTINVEFDPGCQRLNGERLLQYARTRATQGGDFDRARRQQEVLDAVRAEVLSLGGVANFITQIPRLWNELSDSYRTNLSIEQIISLGFLMGEIDGEDIRFAVIDNNYVDLGKSPEGDDILIPHFDRIRGLISRVMNPRAAETPADLLSRAQDENATIRVYNGTDISGLAARTQEWLTGRGIQVSGTGNAPDHNGAPTVIRDYGTARWTSMYLADLLGLPPERIQPGTDGLAADGVVIVVGPDIQPLLSGE